MKPKIILADNDLTFRQSLNFLITIDDNAEVIGKASDGNELMKLLTCQTPDLILLNIDIPCIDGLETIRSIRKNYQGVNIIVFSMFEFEDTENELIKAGVKACFRKSEAIRDLKNELRALVSRKNEKIQIEMPLVKYMKKMSLGKQHQSVDNKWIKSAGSYPGINKKWSYIELNN